MIASKMVSVIRYQDSLFYANTLGTASNEPLMCDKSSTNMNAVAGRSHFLVTPHSRKKAIRGVQGGKEKDRG